MRETADTESAPVLHLLGECRLYVAGDDASPRGRKARALLGFLAVAPDRSATRERLADLLWTDRGPEQARGSLRQALAEIRGTGDRPFLLADRERVALDGGGLRTDIDCIELAAGERDASGLAVCVGGIRGPFLDRLEGLSPAYDEWLYAERTRQHDRVLAIVLDAVDGMTGPGIQAGAAAELQTIVRSLEHLDPLNEAVARLGMRVDHAGRDTASLHRRYRRLKEGLAREFECEPSERTRALFAELTSLPETAVGPAPSAADGAERAGAEPALAGTGPPTIIVAPIEADGAPGAGGDLAAICTDDIRAALSRLPHLRVIALDTPDDRDLARLRAGAIGAYLLSGRLRRVGDQLSVTLRIGSLEDRAVLWSEQLRIGSEDLFEAIDRIVERAAGAVTPSIDRDLAARLDDRPAPTNAAAGPLFTEARIRIKTARSLGDLQDAAAKLERVLELSPNHLTARLLLAQMYNTDFFSRLAGHDVRSFRARADRLCREASALEPSNPNVIVHRAWCHLRRREWDRAERDFERVLGMLPYDADTVDGCAFGLCHLGLLDRAEPLFQQAFRLNPFPPADYHADHAVMLALRGDAEAAEEHFDVSGERNLQYVAVRLANTTRLNGDGRPHGLRRAFARRFRGVWQQPRPPATDDVLNWVEDTLPFKLPHHRALVRDGLAAALGDGW